MKGEITLLSSTHDRKDFTCGRDELDRWFSTTALQHQNKGFSRVFVLASTENPKQVFGFYSLSSGELETENMPKTKSLPRIVPIARIGRLATASVFQGKRMGETLLINAIERIVMASQAIGIYAIVVDAKDESAAAFYRKYDFMPLTDNPLTLVLPTQTAITLLEPNDN